MKLKIDYFLAGLVCVVIAGFIFPALGASGGPIHLDLVTDYGISGVFFLYGLTLAPERMLQGFKNIKVHVAVQLLTFAVFPAVVLVAQSVLPDFLPSTVKIGLFYVAALPSTVSSSVAMVSLARGNVPVALFNATLSSLIGVVLTPLWMAWYLHSVGISIPLLPTLAKVGLVVVVPIVLGQIGRHWLLGWITRNSYWVKHVDRFIILAIVMNSVSDATAAGIWMNYKPILLVETALAAMLLFVVIYVIALGLSRLLGFDRDNKIAFLFCGSKKSLAVGVPLAPVIFGNMPDIGLVIVPIMVFHFFQLVVVSGIASRYARTAPHSV
ncbi:bile acid:sodium symporter family protein [Mesorhizobium sp. BAC0120]|uniref:bile acid:sodium symporter family protein n=1 Tax=Mesorhizobium sp. BAC0120 TaxID=3090670 RepID=UPI00298CDC10|nr:bile acid:sodium symporter family protein [Mesorhizobium sp. BAC0120]MDW6022086.1 bile acid:sodium symporter family protein [Mesorhizobium sp. BAC0120]